MPPNVTNVIPEIMVVSQAKKAPNSAEFERALAGATDETPAEGLTSYTVAAGRTSASGSAAKVEKSDKTGQTASDDAGPEADKSVAVDDALAAILISTLLPAAQVVVPTVPADGKPAAGAAKTGLTSPSSEVNLPALTAGADVQQAADGDSAGVQPAPAQDETDEQKIEKVAAAALAAGLAGSGVEVVSAGTAQTAAPTGKTGGKTAQLKTAAAPVEDAAPQPGKAKASQPVQPDQADVRIQTVKAVPVVAETLARQGSPANGRPAAAQSAVQGSSSPVEAAPVQTAPAQPAVTPQGAKVEAAAIRPFQEIPEPLRSIGMSVARLNNQQGQEVRLQLYPASMGRVDVKLNYQGSQVHVQLVAEVSQTGNLLDRHQSELRNALQEAGVNVGQLSVSVGDGAPRQPQQFLAPEQAPAPAKDPNRVQPATAPLLAAEIQTTLVDYRV